MYAMPIPVQTKVHFKNLQFLAVMYDMGFLSFAFDVVFTEVFFPLFKQFIETEITYLTSLQLVTGTVWRRSNVSLPFTIV